VSSLDIHHILKKLPHRYPFLLIDRVVEFENGKRIVALKNVMPGVLILEALAQAAALLSFESAGGELADDAVVYFVGIDGARFKRPVEPGDQLMLEAAIDRAKSGIYKYKTRASVAGETAAEAELMCTMRRVG
jgi:3-hydroxyacyl-[acyl-carrier-protein] dehydratase